MTPAEKQRRHRRRQCRGIVVLHPEVELYPFIETLLQTNRITPEAALDRGEINKAAAQVLIDFTRRWPK